MVSFVFIHGNAKLLETLDHETISHLRTFPLLFIFLITLPCGVVAETTEQDLNELCKQHTIESIKTVFQKELPEMTEEQIRQSRLK